MTVVKLKSAEEFLKFDEAKQYIDVRSVYEEFTEEGEDIEESWKESLTILYQLGKDKKFTNSFDYSAYNIIEITSRNKSKVKFLPLNTQGSKIIYDLELRNSQWVVVKVFSE